MLGGGSIISTAIISRFMVKRLIEPHHILGCFFSLIGFVIVGFAGLIGSQETVTDFDTGNLILGLILKIIELILVGVQHNVQEVILRKKAINVQRMIGLEGLFGIIWSFVACLAFSFINCPSNDICTVRFKIY